MQQQPILIPVPKRARVVDAAGQRVTALRVPYGPDGDLAWERGTPGPTIHTSEGEDHITVVVAHDDGRQETVDVTVLAGHVAWDLSADAVLDAVERVGGGAPMSTVTRITDWPVIVADLERDRSVHFLSRRVTISA